MTEVLAVVAVTPPGSNVTVYSVIGLPPFEAGAVHETIASTSSGIADTSVGAPGGPMGITALEEAELRLGPTEFVAVTVNVYAVSWVRPITVTDVPVVVAVTPPGDEITVYSVMALPPLEAGAVHETNAWRSPGTADTPMGGSGTVAGVTKFDTLEAGLVPRELVAVIVKV